MKPIGYWLNRTDQALTDHMDRMLAEFGLTRLAWQVLNAVQDATETTDGDVLKMLAANADVPALTAAIDTVLTGGWASRPAQDRLALTPQGVHRLAGVAERVEAFRALSMTGISMDEYRTTVSVLERMTHNLETTATPGPAQRVQPT
ncbi:MarR family winged helix-turn-helix transcriptional regulator [Actinomadura verrucosospora]|uniref:Putative transcriptional regulator, MarR family n=1 Tax=Actinomadura verrucosospora TaxID=46165 RepID=A0A7D3ZIP0_ACTVE|nr:MarR family winged helix-turn-helix transcriptional regulator [Actinomadura verrucosospora]QKG19122.1 putative transcriptional regulator, MarR family [Actinomadura verrucosospora]